MTFPLKYTGYKYAKFPGGGGGGGHPGTEGGRTRVTYFSEEGFFFKTSACRDFVKEWYFLYPGTKYGG